MSTAKTKIERLGMLASALDEAHDSVAPSQMRACRKAADGVRSAFDEMDIPLTADTVLALMIGASIEASMIPNNPLTSMLSSLLPKEPKAQEPNPLVMLIVSMLAADVLEGVDP